MIPVSIACGWFCWNRSRDDYEFSGKGIIMRSEGTVRWSVDHAEIEEAYMSPKNDHFEMFLRNHGKNRCFPMPRALHAAIVEQQGN